MIEELSGLLEREKIIKATLHHASRHRVVMLKGSIGIGKTALLETVADKLDAKNKVDALFIYHTTPYKQFLLDILYQLYKREILPEDLATEEWEDLYKIYKRENASKSLSIIYTVFKAHPELTICVDNIDQATLHGLNLFRQLLSSAHPPRMVCTCTTQSRLQYLVWQAEIITIPPLSKSACYQIVDDYITKHGLRVDSPKTFKSQIFTISSGNPLAIANKLKYCRYEPRIKKHLLTGHSQSSGRKELPMNFVIIIIFISAMMSRYIARSIGDTHLYMLSSIIAALTIGGRYFIFQGSGKDTS